MIADMTMSLSTDAALARIAERDYGLRTDMQILVNQMLHDYDPNLSLRAIPERDPAYRPPKTMGVYEEGTKGASSPWVFTIEPEHVDERTFARAVAGDMSKLSHPERMELLKKSQLAAEQKKQADWEQERARRREEMLFIASTPKSTIRHRMPSGETLILADEPGGRSPRTHIS